MELRDQLQEALSGSYTVQRELTRGGMSRVFVATETALDRSVVIKVISPELAAGVSASRFAREIRLAASLQQANIVPLLSAGEAAGLPYYTMPFVAGSSLRDRLNKVGVLPIPEVVSALRDVARALAYAHERNVVHRDIKPDNVLLSGAAAVVTDFGIAKALTAARTEAHDGTITQVGSGVGTPAYMAPEQAAGDPDLDHRADVYAFGCLAYELLAGETPFHGRPAHQMLAAHFAEAAPLVTDKRVDTPPTLAELVAQCLEKDPAKRPESGTALVQRMDHVAITPAAPIRARFARPARRTVVIGGMVLLLVAAGAYALLERGVSSAANPLGRTLAVLPFANVGGDSAQEFLADGMTDELATALGKTKRVLIAARSMAYRYKGRKGVDPREAGHALGAAYVVTGSLRRLGDSILVSAQLNSAGDRQELWEDSYRQGTNDVFAVEDKILQGVTMALAPRLGGGKAGGRGEAVQSGRPDSQNPVAVHGTTNADAYYAYLQGRFLLLSRRDVPRAAQLFQQAIDKDSNFARAYAGLAEALVFFAYFNSTPAAEVRPRVERAARRALALDSMQSSPHVALALAAAHAWEWATAEDEFRRAIAVEPADASARTQYARLLLTLNRPQEARAQLERSLQLEPYSAVTFSWIIQTDMQLGRIDEALADARRGLAIDSIAVPLNASAAITFVRANQPMQALAIAKRLRGERPPLMTELVWVLARAGDRDAALRLADSLDALRPRPWTSDYVIFAARVGGGDTARALDALERSTAGHELWPFYIPVCDEMFDPVRQSARFAAILRAVGLDTPSVAGPNACRAPPP